MEEIALLELGIGLEVDLARMRQAEAERRARLEEEARRRNPRVWVRPWITRREAFGWYDTLMVELEQEDPKSFVNMLRLEPALFHELVDRLTPRVEKMSTRWREPIPAGLRVAITLKFLASGADYKTLMQGFRVPANTISIIIRQVCDAIYDEFKDLVHCPTTREEWLQKADEFGQRWNFFHTLGALDGKHVGLRKPPNSGSLYFNYKKFFSILFLALVDAAYKFMWVQVGVNGAAGDAQIFNNSTLKRRLMNGSLNLPEPSPLPNDTENMPYFFVGDDAFALSEHMMKPYPRSDINHDARIFNYRCSRARRVVENAFGILANRFQCLLRTLPQLPETATKVVLACIVLHNLVRDRYPILHEPDVDREDQAHNVVPGAWREGQQLWPACRRQGGNFGSAEAKQMRDTLKVYYNSEAGSVPWQENMI